MSVNLSVKGVADELAKRLRARAERNHRSLQGELMAILEQAVVADQAIAATPSAQHAKMHRGWKTVEDLMAERRLHPLPGSAGVPLAVDIIRADRDSR